MKGGAVLALLVLPALAGADEIYFKGGGHITGEVVQQDEQGMVTLDVSAGRISVPKTAVERIVSAPSPLSFYRDRTTALADRDLAGWLAVGLWAEEHDLTTQARRAFEHVVALDPSNAGAHRALGHVLQDGHWMTLDESYRSRGYVPFEGSWITPEERRAVLADRQATAEAARVRAESDARVREAEARARVAEAEARRAEASAAAAEGTQVASDGFPYPYVFGSGTPMFTSGFGFTTFRSPGFVPGFVTAPGIIAPFPGFVSHRRAFVNHRTPVVVVNINTRRGMGVSHFTTPGAGLRSVAQGTLALPLPH